LNNLNVKRFPTKSAIKYAADFKAYAIRTRTKFALIYAIVPGVSQTVSVSFTLSFSDSLSVLDFSRNACKQLPFPLSDASTSSTSFVLALLQQRQLPPWLATVWHLWQLLTQLTLPVAVASTMLTCVNVMQHMRNNLTPPSSPLTTTARSVLGASVVFNEIHFGKFMKMLLLLLLLWLFFLLLLLLLLLLLFGCCFCFSSLGKQKLHTKVFHLI